MTKIIFILLLCSFEVFSQENNKINQIDSIVNHIDNSTYKIETDSIIKNFPEYHFSTKKYLTLITDGSELKKYKNFTISISEIKSIKRHISSSNTFYYNNNKLIKVEELFIENGIKKNSNCYFSEDKPIYFTDKNLEKSEEKALLLLKLSNEIVNSININRIDKK